ncbi:MAG: hypothetical protein ACLU38_08790 [Dysosmobacter sp.]
MSVRPLIDARAEPAGQQAHHRASPDAAISRPRRPGRASDEYKAAFWRAMRLQGRAATRCVNALQERRGQRGRLSRAG